MAFDNLWGMSPPQGLQELLNGTQTAVPTPTTTSTPTNSSPNTGQQSSFERQQSRGITDQAPTDPNWYQEMVNQADGGFRPFDRGHFSPTNPVSGPSWNILTDRAGHKQAVPDNMQDFKNGWWDKSFVDQRQDLGKGAIRKSRIDINPGLRGGVDLSDFQFVINNPRGDGAKGGAGDLSAYSIEDGLNLVRWLDTVDWLDPATWDGVVAPDGTTVAPTPDAIEDTVTPPTPAEPPVDETDSDSEEQPWWRDLDINNPFNRPFDIFNDGLFGGDSTDVPTTTTVPTTDIPATDDTGAEPPVDEFPDDPPQGNLDETPDEGVDFQLSDFFNQLSTTVTQNSGTRTTDAIFSNDRAKLAQTRTKLITPTFRGTR